MGLLSPASSQLLPQLHAEFFQENSLSLSLSKALFFSLFFLGERTENGVFARWNATFSVCPPFNFCNIYMFSLDWKKKKKKKSVMWERNGEMKRAKRPCLLFLYC